MGLKSLRTWSVLLLASASLVGCNNTANKDKSLGAGPKVGDPVPLGQAKQPQWPDTKGQENRFPVKQAEPGTFTNTPANPGAFPVNTQNRDPLIPAAGGGLNNKSFAPSDPMAPLPQFPPAPGNASPQPYPAVPNTPAAPVAQPSGFGAGRPEASPSAPVIPNGSLPIPQPVGFPR